MSENEKVETLDPRNLMEVMIRRALFECVDKLGGQVTVNAEDLDFHNYALAVKIHENPLRLVITAMSADYAQDLTKKQV